MKPGMVIHIPALESKDSQVQPGSHGKFPAGLHSETVSQKRTKGGKGEKKGFNPWGLWEESKPQREKSTSKSWVLKS